MSLSVQELLQNKGIKVKESHLNTLETRWKNMQKLRGDLTNVKIDDANIAVRNIPGGDHIE